MTNRCGFGTVLSILLAVVLLASCGGGGGGDPPNNLTAGAIAVTTADPRIGHPLSVNVSLSADRTTNDVTVSLFAIDDTSDPNANVRQIPLGTELIETLPAGTSDHELDVTVPSSVEFSGPYHIAAVVDPVDEIAEEDEEDNTSTVDVTLGPTNEPNVLLTAVDLDHSALIINTDEYSQQVNGTPGNVHNADAGGTITVGANGLEVGQTVDIEAFASLRITRTDNNTTLDVPLYLWNSAEQRYMNAYGIDPGTGIQGAVEWLPMGTFTPQLATIVGDEADLDDVHRNAEHMDFYFPGKLGYELEQALRYPPCTTNCTKSFPQPTIPPPDLTAAAIDQLKAFLSGLPFSGVRGDESVSLAALDFAVCVKIRPTDPSVTDSDTSDNETCPSLKIFLPPLPPGTPLYNIGSYVPVHSHPSETQTSGDGFATRNDNKNFAFNLDFGAGATADNRGYIEEVTAGVPITVFGKSFDFYRITVRAQLVPDYLNKPASERSGFSREIRFLGQVIDASPPITGSISATLISYSKEIEKEQQFFVGPVPMIAGGTVGGNIGLDYNFGYDDVKTPVFGGGNPVVSLGSSIGPFANLEASLYAGVGTKVFSVGVEGVLTLVDERIVYFIGTEIETIDDGFASGDVEFMVTQLQKLSNIFTGPQGKLNLFAKYSVPAVKTCKWGFVKVPCLKLATIKATKNIYSSPALFRREDIIFDDPFKQLDVVIADGHDPAYFVP